MFITPIRRNNYPESRPFRDFHFLRS